MKVLNPGLILLSLALLVSCSKIKKNWEDPGPLKLPPSSLSFDIDFPISELSAGVNSLLKETLIDDVIELNKKGDLLYLTVVKQGNLNLALRENLVFASLPLKVKVAVKKKMMGITFTNRESPIEFSGVLSTNASVSLDEEWNLELDCQEMKLNWETEPTINILGMDLDLTKTMDKALDQNEDKILGELCGSINQAVNFRKALTKVWGDIQKPIRIAKKPDSLWLYTIPEALSAKLHPLDRDTLSVHVAYKTNIHITSDKNTQLGFQQLPLRSDPLSTKSAVLAYLQADIPLAFIESVLISQLKGKEFSYQDYEVKLDDLKLSSQGQQLALTLEVSGDFDSEIVIKGKPALTRDQELTLENFSYEIVSDDQVATAADWISHSVIEGYIANEIFLDASKFLGSLDSLANMGIAKSRLGSKMQTHFDFRDISSYQQRISSDTLQWIFYLEGTAGLTLKKDVFQKKNR